MTKLFKLFIPVHLLLWCFTLTAQDRDADPNIGSLPNQGDVPGDVLAVYDVEAITGETGNLGCEYAFGHLWVTARGLVNPVHTLWKMDVSSGTPVLVASYPQGTSSAWGWRDLCNDGTFLYASDSDLIQQIDPVTGTATGVTIPSPVNPARALAWDPATDHFWTISFGGNLFEIDRAGTIINSFPNPASTYGAGWDSWSAGGPYLWLNGGTSTTLVQVDPLTGLPTGVSYTFGAGLVGGLSISVDLFPGLVVGVAMSQEAPDQVFVVELGDAPAVGPLNVFMDDFEAGLGNWIITNEGSIACVWDTITLASRTPPYTLPPEAVGLGMTADIDFCGTSGDSLYSTATMASGIDATNYTSVTVEFDNDWRIVDADDEAYFEISVDGGTTWTEVASWIGVENRNTHEVHDVSSTAGLQGDVRFRLRVIMPDWDWFWVIDNFAIYVDGFIPVELTSFVATVNETDVTLSWSTATETNNQGFDIERNSGNGFQKVGYAAGFGTSTESHSYSFVDESVAEGSYSYRLKQIDYDGSFEYSDVTEVVVTVPDVYSLQQNYPNPFNPSTTIEFSLAVDSKVSLTVFDILGQEVVSLLNSNLPAGQKTINFDASGLNSGVYFYKVDANGIDGSNFSSIKKMILMK